jgi:hypothetical protein
LFPVAVNSGYSKEIMKKSSKSEEERDKNIKNKSFK